MSERRTKSGQHPAVLKYRQKMASIQDGISRDFSELDKKLEKYLYDSGLSVPPPVGGEDKGTP